MMMMMIDHHYHHHQSFNSRNDRTHLEIQYNRIKQFKKSHLDLEAHLALVHSISTSSARPHVCKAGKRHRRCLEPGLVNRQTQLTIICNISPQNSAVNTLFRSNWKSNQANSKFQ